MLTRSATLHPPGHGGAATTPIVYTCLIFRHFLAAVVVSFQQLRALDHDGYSVGLNLTGEMSQQLPPLVGYDIPGLMNRHDG